MAEKYTIKSVTPTGKPDTGFGVPYYIQFEEDDRTVYAQKKTVPVAGEVWEGEIVDDKYGYKFKKPPYVPGQAAPAESKPAKTPYTPRVYKDNSDGMRQGMCFNNAANYVEAISPEPLAPAQWAKAVKAYAQALYLLGDLAAEEAVPAAEPPKEVTVAEAPKSVQDIFGVTPPPAK